MPLSEDQAAAILAATREVAAAEIMPRFRALAPGEVDAKSAVDDLVTVADTAAERALIARLEAVLPGDAVIGEEAVSADAALLDRLGTGRVAVIDPIDGTWNYAHGLATFGVIVAVVEEGETVWGLLYDPCFDDWVEASRGGGAWFVRGGARRRLTVDSGGVPMGTLAGHLAPHTYPPAARPGLAATMPRVRRATSLGASVHEYRGLCLGSADFVLNAGLHPWDHAAGTLAFREAGGVARLLDGRDYVPTMRQGRLLAARTEAMWEGLAEMFGAALGADG